MTTANQLAQSWINEQVQIGQAHIESEISLINPLHPSNSGNHSPRSFAWEYFHVRDAVEIEPSADVCPF